MEIEDAKTCVDTALRRFAAVDLYLLQHDLSERCIASRVAFHLQPLCPDYFVDVEYNRVGLPPKRLNLPDECANSRDEDGRSLVVPDLIVHQRGPRGRNVLILEFKKTSNTVGFTCDRHRLHAFRDQLGYDFAALIECETREREPHGIRVIEWVPA